tara:strand:+ start:1007 stop:1615 length:609 start_codon:yes stop_codon:yes gene_type:complete
MNSIEFSQKIFFIFEDRNLQMPSKEWIAQLFDKCENSINLNDGFQKIAAIPASDWNGKYGFGGKPNLVEWVEILTGEKPKTDEELAIEHKRWEQSINFYIASIKTWLNDRNFDSTFPQYYRYIDPQNQRLAEIINKTYKKVDRALTKDEILRLFLKLRGEYLEDKDKLTHKLKQSALVIFPEPFKPIIQNQGISLPNFKKIY